MAGGATGLPPLGLRPRAPGSAAQGEFWTPHCSKRCYAAGRSRPNQARIHHRGCIPHRLNQKILRPLNYGRRAQIGGYSVS
jgi:hypothetical protein